MSQVKSIKQSVSEWEADWAHVALGALSSFWLLLLLL